VALLALLALRANRAVSSDVLIDALWGDERAGARKRLQMAVVRLRQALGPLGADGMPVVRTVGGGYLLALPEGELDAEVFRRRLEEGRAALREGEPARASELLTSALELWRGPPLAEVGYEEFAQTEIRRLEELRLLALEARVEAELELGHHAGVIADLEALLVEQPSRERIAGQLMLALYRSGRQADALEVYQRTRAHFAQEFGLAPGPQLTSLQMAILNADQQLLQVPPTVRRASPYPARLPAPTTPFLGRERELAAVVELLRRSRVLTLTGAGGSGKTRLGLRLAEACAEEYRDGAVFVALADITDPELIVPAISQGLGLAELPGTTPVIRLQEWLSQRELLLVLDNLEQLAAGTSVLGELSAACPGVRMLVTSREPLRFGGEQQYEVPLLKPEDAVELFVARGRAVAPVVELDRTTVAAICERLDRLPLAIELTAARVKTLTPAQILDRLERRLPVAATGPRDAPDRHRTLRATADWSYDLLTPEEQQLFARLSVFAGGWTLAAAEAVCAADLDTLGALVDRSLVKVGGEHYWMLQTLREYALDKLAGRGEEDDVRVRQAEWFVEVLEAEDLPQPGRPTERAMVRVAMEQENLRSALEWASGRGMTETVARLASSLAEVWIRLGQLHEAKRWMGLVLERADDYPDRLAAQVVSAARALAWHEGDHAQAMALAQRALALWQRVGDQYAIGREIMSLGRAACSAGDLIRGRTNFEEAIQFAREHDLPELLQAALNGLGDIEIREGNLLAGRSLCEQSRAVGPESTTGLVALLNLAQVARLQADQAGARSLACEALDHALARGDRLTLAWGAFELAWELGEQGELEASGRLLGAAAGFLDTAGAKRDWFIEACEAAMTTLLHKRLDGITAQSLIERGRSISLEDAVRQARETAAPVQVGERHAGGAAAIRLPVPTTPFLGREHELAVAAGLLRGRRLLTLTGAGGSGKTRLALRLAAVSGGDYGEGAVFVGFADIADPELIVPAISQALGLGEVPDRSPIERLAEWLGRRELLLVLDNLEQLTSGAGVLGELLSRCPGLSLLVTSREPLHLGGEQQYEVPPLELGDAVGLFVARGRAVAPNAEVDRDIVAAICERLDRLPLAIELTAARAKALSPAQLLDRLERRLPVAATGPRDAPDRQRTLKATTDWSYELLTVEERLLFTRLSVFAGGWTLAAAEAVCGADLDRLTALVDRSLIKADGERYWMLQILREYALDKLTRSGEENEVRRRHAQWFVELLRAHSIGEHSIDVHPDTLRVKLGADRENLRAALDWAHRAEERDTVARLAIPLSSLWILEGHSAEAERWLGMLSGRINEFAPTVQAALLAVTRQLAGERGRYGEAFELVERALIINRELGNVEGAFWETFAGAVMLGYLGDLDRARAWCLDALQLARDQLPKRVPDALIGLADLELAEKQLDRARACCQQALELAPRANSLAVFAAWINLAHIANIERRTQDAADMAQRVFADSFSGGQRVIAACAAMELAWALAERVPPELTARSLGAALEMWRHAGIVMQRTEAACAEAIRNVLQAQGLSVTATERLIDEGRTIALHQAVAQELDHAAGLGRPAELAPRTPRVSAAPN